MRIDTTNKTIVITSPTLLEDFIRFVKEHNFEDYRLVSDTYTQPFYDPFNPNIIYC